MILGTDPSHLPIVQPQIPNTSRQARQARPSLSPHIRCSTAGSRGNRALWLDCFFYRSTDSESSGSTVMMMCILAWLENQISGDRSILDRWLNIVRQRKQHATDGNIADFGACHEYQESRLALLFLFGRSCNLYEVLRTGSGHPLVWFTLGKTLHHTSNSTDHDHWPWGIYRGKILELSTFYSWHLVSRGTLWPCHFIGSVFPQTALCGTITSS